MQRRRISLKRGPSSAQRAVAADLRRYLGAPSDVGVRYSAATIARELPTLWQRTPATANIVREKMGYLVSLGVAERAAGPRGGVGWTLTALGAAFARGVEGRAGTPAAFNALMSGKTSNSARGDRADA